ncbi:MAG: alpha/beta fold hydrolase [Leptospiraceae bacterium]|nr:alpha/beta fold hydrolase [Leptospiraceae bacterium]
MKLFHRAYPNSNLPLIIIHGLFGSSKNWISNAKELSKLTNVYSIDVRNHGDSPHADTHTIQELVLDLKNFIEENNIEKPILLGHSMGGLNALLFALTYPELIHSLIVVDIAPKSYQVNYESEFNALSMDVSNFESRQSIDDKMKEILPDSFIRQFLQMNLEKTETGYKWKLNINTLKNSQNALNLNLSHKNPFLKKCLFILGEKSDYIVPDDLDLIRKYFPIAKIETIKEAGHYLHYTHAKEFLEIVSNFIREL